MGASREARDQLEEGLRLAREVGDNWVVASRTTTSAMHSAGCGETRPAREHYGEALGPTATLNEQWALTYLLEDIAMLAAQEGQP